MKICNYERVSLLGCFRDYKSLKGMFLQKDSIQVMSQMQWMYHGCRSLTTLNLFAFNRVVDYLLSSWARILKILIYLRLYIIKRLKFTKKQIGEDKTT